MQAGEGEHRVFICFEMHAKQNEARTVLEGRPIFDELEYVKVQTPGDKSNIIHRAVTDEDRTRWRAAYRAWKDGTNTDGLAGTPLAEWPLCKRSMVEEMAFFGIRTVEQLAAVSDGNIKNVGPIMSLRQKARDWLEQAKANAGLTQMRAELEKRDNDIETLRRITEEQAADLAELKAELRAALGTPNPSPER